MALRNADRVPATTAERMRKYRKAHPEVARAYRESNRNRLSTARAAWRRLHPDRDAASRRRYEESRKRPATDRREYERGWYRRNRGKVLAASRAYSTAHPEKGRAKRARRRARQAAVTVVTFTDQQLDARLSMFGYRCWLCGGPYEEVDHVKPLARGGPHILSNLRPACLPCNRRKAAS